MLNNENIVFRFCKDIIGCFKRGNRSLLILPIDVDFVLMKRGERFLWDKSAVAVDFSRIGKVKMHVVIFKSTGSDFSIFTLFLMKHVAQETCVKCCKESLKLHSSSENKHQQKDNVNA